MNDAELTVLATKAFGNASDMFSPLTDDGDALKLAVKLQLGISIPPVVDGRVDVVTFYGPIISIVEYPQDDDRNAAVRRAVVRAAAEIGKVQQCHTQAQTKSAQSLKRGHKRTTSTTLADTTHIAICGKHGKLLAVLQQRQSLHNATTLMSSTYLKLSI